MIIYWRAEPLAHFRLTPGVRVYAYISGGGGLIIGSRVVSVVVIT